MQTFDNSTRCFLTTKESFNLESSQCTVRRYFMNSIMNNLLKLFQKRKWNIPHFQSINCKNTIDAFINSYIFLFSLHDQACFPYSGSPNFGSYSPKRSPMHPQSKRSQKLMRKYEDKNIADKEHNQRKGKYKGGLGRDCNTLMELHLNKVLPYKSQYSFVHAECFRKKLNLTLFQILNKMRIFESI